MGFFIFLIYAGSIGVLFMKNKATGGNVFFCLLGTVIIGLIIYFLQTLKEKQNEKIRLEFETQILEKEKQRQESIKQVYKEKSFTESSKRSQSTTVEQEKPSESNEQFQKLQEHVTDLNRQVSSLRLKLKNARDINKNQSNENKLLNSRILELEEAINKAKQRSVQMQHSLNDKEHENKALQKEYDTTLQHSYKLEDALRTKTEKLLYYENLTPDEYWNLGLSRFSLDQLTALLKKISPQNCVDEKKQQEHSKSVEPKQLNCQLQSLIKELNRYVALSTSKGEPVVSKAYEAYIVERKKKTVEQILADILNDVTFVLDSVGVYNILLQYIHAQNVWWWDSVTEAVCQLIKEMTGEELFPLQSIETQRSILQDIYTQLTQYGIKVDWLLSHGILLEQNLPKLQHSRCTTILKYTKIKSGIRIDSTEACGRIIVPDFIEHTPVVSISSTAFNKRTDITAVVLPRYLTEIEEGAFAHSNITSIIIPDNVEKIGERAFFNCKRLTSVKLPLSLKRIKYNTFGGCISLSSISIPSSVFAIDGMAFNDCKKLKHIQAPCSIVRIGYSAFPVQATVYCDDDSRAYRYAIENRMPPCKPFDLYENENKL